MVTAASQEHHPSRICVRDLSSSLCRNLLSCLHNGVVPSQ